MKRLFLIFLSFMVLSISTTFAGTFYNPKPGEMQEKGREAAEKLNESFVKFYQMLKNIEGKKIEDAKSNKLDFDKLLNDSLAKFRAINEDTPNRPLRFELNDKLRNNLEWIKSKYFNNRPIDTERKLTMLPVTTVNRLVTKSQEFEIKPERDDFYPKLRSLIIVAIDVQWVGVKVSELWAVSY